MAWIIKIYENAVVSLSVRRKSQVRDVQAATVETPGGRDIVCVVAWKWAFNNKATPSFAVWTRAHFELDR
jgi:hypothetical protein